MQGDLADPAGERAKRELDWRPSRRSIVEELRSYASTIV
jgi:hypothetical protein